MKDAVYRIRNTFSDAPLLGWLLGAVAAVALEQFLGMSLAEALGLEKIPVLFGCNIILKKPLLAPGAIVYVLFIYVVPILAVAKLTSSLANRMAGSLLRVSAGFSVIVHLGLLYASLHIWSGISDYRVLTLKLTLIAIMVTLSLNVVNGYMGEFSCSHPGFIALGAYGASVFSVTLFVKHKLFGAALLPAALGPFMFPLSLIAGGCVAALGALADCDSILQNPGRLSGDYLAGLHVHRQEHDREPGNCWRSTGFERPARLGQLAHGFHVDGCLRMDHQQLREIDPWKGTQCRP